MIVCLFHLSSLPRSRGWEKGGEQTNHSETQCHKQAAQQQVLVISLSIERFYPQLRGRLQTEGLRCCFLEGSRDFHGWLIVWSCSKEILQQTFHLSFLQTAYSNITRYFNVHTLIIYFNRGQRCESDWFVCGRPCGLRVIVCDLPSGSVLSEALWSRIALSL